MISSLSGFQITCCLSFMMLLVLHGIEYLDYKEVVDQTVLPLFFLWNFDLEGE